jgi:hypothetical protein
MMDVAFQTPFVTCQSIICSNSLSSSEINTAENLTADLYITGIQVPLSKIPA